MQNNNNDSHFVCRVCGLLLPGANALRRHNCRQTHAASASASTLFIDKIIGDASAMSPKQCAICSAYFGSDAGLAKHVAAVHENMPPPPPLHPYGRRISEAAAGVGTANVSVAGALKRKMTPAQRRGKNESSYENVTSSSGLPQAFVQTLAQAITVKKEPTNKEASVFDCKFCAKTSRSSRDHERHVRLCNPTATPYDIFDEPHECPLCQRLFCVRMHLERHFHMKHRGQSWGLLDNNIDRFEQQARRAHQLAPFAVAAKAPGVKSRGRGAKRQQVVGGSRRSGRAIVKQEQDDSHYPDLSLSPELQ